MKLTEIEVYIIKQVKEKGKFEPEDGSYNTVLKGLKQKGWLKVIGGELEAPAFVGESSEFSKKYRDHFE